MVDAVSQRRDVARCPGGKTVFSTAATTVPASATRILAQAEIVKADRETVLGHLERHEVGHRLGWCAVDQAIAGLGSAITARIREYTDEIAAAARMRAADRDDTNRTEKGRRCLVGNRLRKRTKHHVDDPAHWIEVAATRRRVFGRQQGARRHVETDRAEGSTVDRDVGEDVLDRDVTRGQGRVARHVLRSTRLRAGAAEIKMHLLALDGDRQAHRNRLVDDAVVVDPVLEAVGAIGQVGDVGAHLALRIGDHFIEALAEHLAAVFLDQRLDAAVADGKHVGHRRQVAGNFGRQAHVGADERNDGAVQLAFFVQLDRRDDDAFLVDIGRLWAPAAGHVAAHVHPVAGGRHDRE